jgi:predicted acetyltransferase
MKKPFKFINPGRLVDGDLELILVRKRPGDPVKKRVPSYEFRMRRVGRTQKAGYISLRVGSMRAPRYRGHIGYRVSKRYRGHRYAARGCRLLLPLAQAHGLKWVWVSTGPKNMAS